MFDGLQELVEITLTFFDVGKSGVCSPWIPLELSITQAYLLDSMSGLIRKKNESSEMVKN